MCHFISIQFSCCCWCEERVQRVFQVIKVSQAGVCECLLSQAQTKLHISIYIVHTHKHIVQLDERNQSTQNPQLAATLMVDAVAVTVFVSTLPLLRLLRFLKKYYFLFSSMLQMFIFPAYRFVSMIFWYIVIEPLSARSIWNVHMFIACKM